jgi:hypothetical protein
MADCDKINYVCHDTDFVIILYELKKSALTLSKIHEFKCQTIASAVPL